MDIRKLAPEDIDGINYQLLKKYGREELAGGQVKFRVVWADDQFEKRWMTHTDDGFQLIHPEVREVPKYKHYIRERYILERLVPVVGETDLTTKVSYEPAWVFETGKTQEYLPPRLDACIIIIDSLYYQMDKKNGFAKYRDNTREPEERKKELKKMYEVLYGNETETGDALAHGYGVTVPSSFEKSTKQGE